jgi:diguanylate cyclase (GGDEF)-like protein/PAS domain S-box-containing protein
MSSKGMSEKGTRTKRKQREKVTLLNPKEDMYQRIVETAMEGIWLLDAAGKTSYVNQHLAEMLGYEPSEMTGRSLFDFMDEDARLEAERLLERRRQGISEHHKFRFRHKDGWDLWAIVATNAILDSQGQFSGALGMITDITERKQMEEALQKSNENFKVVQELSLAAFTILRSIRDEQRRIADFEWTYANPMAGQILKHPPEQLIGQRLLEILPGNRENIDLFDRYKRIVETGQGNEVELHYQSEGINGWFRNMAVKLGDGVAISFSDITEHKLAEAELRENETRYRMLFNSMDAAVLILRDATCIECNSAALKLFGLSKPDELIGKTPMDFAPAIQPNGRTSEEMMLRNAEMARSQGTHLFEWQSIHSGGKPLWMEVRLSPFQLGNESLFQCIAWDITDRKKVEEALRKANETLQAQLSEIQTLQATLRDQAIRDPLTGLYNRRYLYETMEREAARAKRDNYPISVAMIDIDHFKDFNDKYGHQTGDEMLVAIGNLLLHKIRQGDIACRYGGEEFILIMPGECEEDAGRRLSKICREFNNLRIDPNEPDRYATISIGIACYPKHGDDMNQVIKTADFALYQAKQAGRNRVQIWEGK